MRKVLYVLGQLSDEDVDWLAQAGERRSIAAGEAMVVEGEPMEWIFFVLEGHVTVSLAGVGELARLGAGEIVGEMSLVDSRPPSASVHAAEATQALAVAKAVLLERLDRDCGFAARFYKAVAIFMSHRMRHTVLTLGYGQPGAIDSAAGQGLDDAGSRADEVDIGVLDNLNKAGARFDRLVRRVLVP